MLRVINSNLAGLFPAGGNLPLAGILHLLVVYFVWGSTFLGIRIAVREGSGFPPFTMGATRMLAAGILLLLYAVVTGKRVRLSRRELVIVAVSGVLIWNGANGTVTWVEQRADSGPVALMFGVLPIWVAIIESILDRRMPSPMVIGGLLVGLAGLALLTLPGLNGGSGGMDAISMLAVLLGSIAFGIASVLQRRNPIDLTPTVSSGYQHLFGMLGYVVLTLLFDEPLPTPSAQAWGAWVYLVVFGSLFAFTSFVIAIKMLPNRVVATHAYVSPVVAVLLGWLVLSEPITLYTIAGAGLVLVGVAGVFRGRHGQHIGAD